MYIRRNWWGAILTDGNQLALTYLLSLPDVISSYARVAKESRRSPLATSNPYRAQSGLEFYPDETSTKFNPLLTIKYIEERERGVGEKKKKKKRGKERGTEGESKK